MSYERMSDAELNRLAAEKIMGYKRTVGWEDQYNLEGWYHPSRPKEIIRHGGWKPTEPGNEAQAFQLIEALPEIWYIEISRSLPNKYVCTIYNYARAEATIPGRAIVIAALKAMER